MNFYAFAPVDGKEPLGTARRTIIRNLKTIRGAKKRAERTLGKGFRMYTFTNFYDDKTFKLVHNSSGTVPPKGEL